MTDFAYRPSLDGLRCLAVVAVIVYHLDGRWLPGGFLGVDVFFTLSGYLITSLLLVEHQRTSRISFGRFWSRRARRLIPASLIVLIAVTAWLARQDRGVQAARRGEIVAAALDVANWQLIRSGQSYFAGFIGVSPLRHFWSLAIEEQFYIVWPLTCALLLKMRRPALLGWFCLVAATGSAVLCALLYDPVDPSRAYYGTDTRVHQILLGSLLACLLQRRRVAARPAPDLAWAGVLGLTGLVCAAALVHDQSVIYYRGGSVIVALLTALVIVGVESSGGRTLRTALSWRPLVAVGVISYGLYLWHWPIIVWVQRGTFGIEGTGVLTVVRLGLMLLAAVVSYRLVERPVRRSRGPLLAAPRRVAGLAAAAVACVLVFAAVVTWDAQLPAWARTDGVVSLPPTPAGAASLDDGVFRVGVVGDSVAVSMLPGLRTVAQENGWGLLEAAIRACPVAGQAIFLDDGTPGPKNTTCATDVPALREAMLAQHPRVVMWHDLQSTFGVAGPAGVLAAGTPEWTSVLLDDWQAVLDQLRASGADVIIIVPMLRSQDPVGCTGASISPSRCRDIQKQDNRIRAATEEFLRRNAGDPGVHPLRLDDIVCPNGVPCPSVVDGLQLRLGDSDQTHFTDQGSAFIATYLAAAIEADVGSPATAPSGG